ncbi:uncharacterized protein LOC121991155 [Zingiber officinale]|uniref:Uncharacterized protein n=1 Tax=Zingiber officinale TaxID=94328 RepID=A0A8J5KR07_ZINOF|nr:uncharacterized protein LOC121991155 [Zingiber officinale]KAG6496253.1 hypothetical protein ZIOFF_044112 [Zingiber officinale]
MQIMDDRGRPLAKDTEAAPEGRRTRPTTPADPQQISAMEPVTREAYGGGLYGTDQRPPGAPLASATQSADGPAQPDAPPKHRPPPSTGDRDLDITGQSYIQ